jgi:DNA-binding response OmpR family regulator
MRILLIEDDESMATTIVQHLLNQRYLVNTAGKSETGLEMAEAYEYDLIVLDDIQLTERIELKAARWNWYVQVAPHPDAVRTLLRQHRPDVILLDLTFPDSAEYGLTLLDQLTRQMPNLLCQGVRNNPQWTELPILILSAHTDSETRRQVLTVGADDYVQKPIVEPELVVRVMNRIERSQLHQQLVKRSQAQTQAQITASTEPSP